MEPVFIALIGAVSGIAGAAVPVWLTRKNYPSQRIQDGASIVEAAEGVVGLLQAEMGRLRDDVSALRAELGAEERRTDELEQQLGAMRRTLLEYRRGISLLITQLIDLGHHPMWRPDDEDEDEVGGTPV